MKHKFIVSARRFLPCTADEFYIDGKEAYLSEFGEFVDNRLEPGLDFECNKTFRCKPFENNTKIAKSYNLDKKSYDELCAILSEKFFVGLCDCCL